MPFNDKEFRATHLVTTTFGGVTTVIDLDLAQARLDYVEGKETDPLYSLEDLCELFVDVIEYKNGNTKRRYFEKDLRNAIAFVDRKNKDYNVTTYGGVWYEGGMKFIAKLNDKLILEKYSKEE